MSLIKTTFERLKTEKKTALIPYITAGDSDPKLTVPMMHALVDAGADIIELGVPFSDPMADGPAIQLACERALAHQVSLKDVLAMVREFRTQNQTTPVVLMGYLNPIEIMGYDIFVSEAKAAGVSGVLTVDMPPEESTRLVEPLKAHGMDPIFLLAPTSTSERIQSICAQASGFVYYVSLKGVTGSATLDTESVKNKLAEIRQHTDLPLGVGFGIKDAQTAKIMGEMADAVVIGSAIVNRIASHADSPVEAVLPKVCEDVSGFISSVRDALDEGH